MANAQKPVSDMTIEECTAVLITAKNGAKYPAKWLEAVRKKEAEFNR